MSGRRDIFVDKFRFYIIFFFRFEGGDEGSDS